jgi:hypothetical protein
MRFRRMNSRARSGPRPSRITVSASSASIASCSDCGSSLMPLAASSSGDSWYRLMFCGGPGIELAVDAVEAGGDQRRRHEIGIAAGIRQPDLQRPWERARRPCDCCRRRRCRPAPRWRPTRRGRRPGACRNSRSAPPRRTARAHARARRREIDRPFSTGPCPTCRSCRRRRSSALAEPTDTWKCAPLPARFENGFGMKVAIMPCLWAISLAAIFTKVKLSADLSASA